jgi:cysteine desulfurase
MIMRAYFDGNATTPLWAEASDEWRRLGETHWMNPSALYEEAVMARSCLDEYRQQLASETLGRAEDMIFTGGATEGNNAVLRHWAASLGGGLVSALEHPSVSWVLTEPHSVAELWPVCRSGQVSLEWLKERLQKEKPPAWVALQSVNNETGVIQPMDEVLKILQPYDVPLLCDASQHYGKLPSRAWGDQVWVVGCAHKFGGPRGVGWIRMGRDREKFSIQYGGGQERGVRAGTENLQAVGAMVVALRKAQQWRAGETLMKSERDRMEERLLQEIPGVVIVGRESPRVDNTSLIIFPKHNNHRWVSRMNTLGFCIATGAACSSAKEMQSSGLLAMGYSIEQAKRAVRISAGWWNTASDWIGLTEALLQVWNRLEGEDSSAVIELPE